MEVDKHNWAHMPLKLYGRHSLESYGVQIRIRGEFGKTTDWKEFVSRNAGLLHSRRYRYTQNDHFRPY